MGIRARLIALDRTEAKNAPRTREGAPEIDLDKAWHGIHYLLTGDAWGGKPPLGNAVLGGTEVGPDAGYGPARLVSVEQVAALAEALTPLTPDVFVTRFDAEALTEADIYPQIWDEGEEVLGYLKTVYGELRDFYIGAAQRKDAVLVEVS